MTDGKCFMWMFQSVVINQEGYVEKSPCFVSHFVSGNQLKRGRAAMEQTKTLDAWDEKGKQDGGNRANWVTFLRIMYIIVKGVYYCGFYSAQTSLSFCPLLSLTNKLWQNTHPSHSLQLCYLARRSGGCPVSQITQTENTFIPERRTAVLLLWIQHVFFRPSMLLHGRRESSPSM